jgi:hypothetical protein
VSVVVHPCLSWPRKVPVVGGKLWFWIMDVVGALEGMDLVSSIRKNVKRVLARDTVMTDSLKYNYSNLSG